MIPLVGQELEHIRNLNTNDSVLPISFSRISSPHENSLICAFMFALYDPYRTGMLEDKKVSRKQIARKAVEELRIRYPSEHKRIAEVIASTCDYFDVNAAVYQANFTTVTIYTPFSGLADRTVIISRLDIENHYELIAAEMKGIMRVVFETTSSLIQRIIGDIGTTK